MITVSHVIFMQQPENAGIGQRGAAFPAVQHRATSRTFIIPFEFGAQIGSFQFDSVQCYLYSTLNNRHCRKRTSEMI